MAPCRPCTEFGKTAFLHHPTNRRTSVRSAVASIPGWLSFFVARTHPYVLCFFATHACWEFNRKGMACMLSSNRFAAIDIGSNAVRLLLSQVFETQNGPFFRKISLIRMPIRMGKDAFITGKISKDKADQLLATIQGFKSLVTAYGPLDFRSVGGLAHGRGRTGPKIQGTVGRYQ